MNVIKVKKPEGPKYQFRIRYKEGMKEDTFFGDYICPDDGNQFISIGSEGDGEDYPHSMIAVDVIKSISISTLGKRLKSV